MRRHAARGERALTRTMMLARAGYDIATFADELVQQLRSLIPHSAACVLTLDPATGLLTGSYKFGGLAGVHDQDRDWAQLEYGSDDPTRMEAIAQRQVPALAASHLPGGVDDSVRIRNLVGPAGYGDELRMVAGHADHAWGAVNLFRAADERPFDHDETLLLAKLSEAVATGLRAGLIVRSAADPADLPYGPATLLISGDRELRQSSFGSDVLLDELTGQDHRSPAESIIHGLVAAAHRYASGGSVTLPRVRLRSPSGRWLLAQAAPLSTEDGFDGDVVVTIDEARPPEIVSLLASTLGLTAREREVTQLVLTGCDTRTIALELSLSAYTVQDHLKSVFDKADVRSRRELMARVFFEQYAPRLTDDVGPSGWFRPGPGVPPEPIGH